MTSLIGDLANSSNLSIARPYYMRYQEKSQCCQRHGSMMRLLMILVELDTNLGFFSVGNSQPTVKTKQKKIPIFKERMTENGANVSGLEHLKAIEKNEHLTEWANPIITMKKSYGTLILCLDIKEAQPLTATIYDAAL
ncbi:hypothetical protein QYM36_004164 [Artemia franciscana]|uniref:Uncharacterized protein n=1 Tax=Artemia franciscana TaxID=6661 RepID=A0AA88IE69_ARTSF|nr:hypothetical protein QYM36_004164 [Artemia franciscana]